MWENLDAVRQTFASCDLYKPAYGGNYERGDIANELEETGRGFGNGKAAA
ncbi:hypothetical protein BH09MYX1_BH09MYX1_53100 [soil metagenome]